MEPNIPAPVFSLARLVNFLFLGLVLGVIQSVHLLRIRDCKKQRVLETCSPGCAGIAQIRLQIVVQRFLPLAKSSISLLPRW